MSSAEIMKLQAVVNEYNVSAFAFAHSSLCVSFPRGALLQELIEQFLVNVESPEYDKVWAEVAGAKLQGKGTRTKARDGMISARNFFSKFISRSKVTKVPKQHSSGVDASKPVAPQPGVPAFVPQVRDLDVDLDYSFNVDELLSGIGGMDALDNAPAPQALLEGLRGRLPVPGPSPPPSVAPALPQPLPMSPAPAKPAPFPHVASEGDIEDLIATSGGAVGEGGFDFGDIGNMEDMLGDDFFGDSTTDAATAASKPNPSDFDM